MDFLDVKKKKAHKFRLFVGYALVAVALGMSTILIVLLTSGYDIDRSTGIIIQNGLTIVDSKPVAADIYVDGQMKGRTDERLLLPEGSYQLELRAKGYRQWQHKVTLEGSSIEQLVYPFLFPDKIKPIALKNYDALPSFASQSPDRRWLVLQITGKLGGFEVIDLNDDRSPRTEIALPVDTFTPAEGIHTFKEVEWSSDNTHLLLEHTWSNGREYILLNRANPLQSLNISKLFPAQAGFNITLKNKKIDQFYLYNPETTSLLNGVASTRTVNSLLSNALQFKSYKEDTLIYVNKNKEVHIIQKGRDYLIRSLPEASKYMLDFAEFNGKAFLVVGSASEGKVFVYEDPLRDLQRVPARAPQPTRVLVVPDHQYVSFSANARFVMVQGGSKFAVFDAETRRQFRYDIGLRLENNQKATWMDGHRILLNSASRQYVFDFDGTNLQALLSVSPASWPFFNRDYNAMFTFADDGGKVTMQRSKLIVE